MKMLVTGGSGMLGHELLRQACGKYEVWGSYHRHRVDVAGATLFPLDLADESDLREKLGTIKPNVIVHTAALTDVDACEREPAAALEINAYGTRRLAQISEDLNARLVYISTDYVFDGKTGNYREEDMPNPINHYGDSKLRAEEWAIRCCSRALIVRTTIFGLKIVPKKGMIESLVEALRSGAPITRFADQYFTPVYCGQLSTLVLQLLDLGAVGLYHVGSSDKVSRHEFARRVADRFAPTCEEIVPIPFRQIEGIAKRPRDTSLVSEKLKSRFDIPPPRLDVGLALLSRDWQDSSGGALYHQ